MPFDDYEDRRKCRGQKYHCVSARVVTSLARCVVHAPFSMRCLNAILVPAVG